MKIISVSDIVEKNGNTIRENNWERSHDVPLGTLVEVKYSHWLKDGACLRAEARLWVVSHDRDCDGTPLYSLADRPMNVLEIMVEDVCREITGEKVPVCEEKRRTSDGRVLHGEYRFWEILNGLGVVRETGFPERSLTLIEVTDELKRGEGSLRWDEGE